MPNRAIQGHSDNKWRKPDLRHGYTTSACAAACAAAGIVCLATGEILEHIMIDLPTKEKVLFELSRCEILKEGVLCGTIKDSGDDPDVTHGTEIQVLASRHPDGIVITGGRGVGRVTKPGLPVDVGQPAINPGPLRLIKKIVGNTMSDFQMADGIKVEIRVPDGEELAQQTLNPRLGIVGGISILGNSGILKPFSNSAYKASIYTELKVAKANPTTKVVLTTGSRSEQYAMQIYPDLPEWAFIQVGDHMDFALKHCRKLGLRNIVISGMIGKISKLAQGRMQTHVSQGLVDFDFLADIAQALGAETSTTDRIRTLTTAHHVNVVLNEAGIEGLEQRLMDMAAKAAFEYASELKSLDVLLFTIKGKLVCTANVRKGL